MKRAILVLSLLVFAGCVGSPIHSTLTYGGIKKTIKRNNAALMKLRTGMSQEDVLLLMGEPERSEGYHWGSAWLYRTAMTEGIHGGIYGSIDSDYTPVMFDKNGILEGWGRNYFEQSVNKYDITVQTKP